MASEPLDLSAFDGITPGEWAIPTEPVFNAGIVCNGSLIAAVAPVGSNAECRANQRAIAALPKLLAEVTRLRAVEAELRGEMKRKDEALKSIEHGTDDQYAADIALGALSPEVPRE